MVSAAEQTDPMAHAIAEVDALRDAGRTVTTLSGLEVYCAQSHEIPALMILIGIARSSTFRAVGMGNEKEVDLDAHDEAYHQLFVWDPKSQALVSATRLGLADQLLRTKGRASLYSNGVFDWGPSIDRKLSEGMEVGRTLVTLPYQGSMLALALLWRGLGVLLGTAAYARPVLFGTVTLSVDMGEPAHRLLVGYLKEKHLHPQHTEVAPRTPPEFSTGGLALPKDVKALGQALKGETPTGEGVPMLLKRYLALGAEVLGFGVDPSFRYCLDIMVAVDLRKSDPVVVSRYVPGGLRLWGA